MSDKKDGVASRADANLLNTLHQLIAQDLIRRISGGEATIQDIAAAAKFLKDNNVTADVEYSQPLGALEQAVTPVGELPFITDGEDEDESC